MTTRITNPETGATLIGQRQRIVSETLCLKAEPTVDLLLCDLRRLVDAAAHLPGEAVVDPREGQIFLSYRLATEDNTDPDVPSPVVAPDAVREVAVAVQERQCRDENETPAAPESAPAVTGDNALVDDVRELVTRIKKATGLTTAAVAELAEVPTTSLATIMTPSYKSRTTRRSTYDKLREILDELVAEGADTGDAAVRAVS